MILAHLTEQAIRYLNKFCLEIPGRRTGSAGNRQAVAFFAETIAGFGFQVETPEVDCLDWTNNGAELTVAGERFEVFASPYSNPCRAAAPLADVERIEQLAGMDYSGQILLLHGEIAKEQLMPKNFTFYNPEEHQRIYQAVEAARPAALVTAAAWSPDTAGAVYPCPLFEDGDFDIPSAYLSESEGARLASCAGQVAHLAINTVRTPAKASNVYAVKNPQARQRVVVFAHIDAKDGTPGALDNAAGASVLLLLAEVLADYQGRLGIELVAINGEDDYSAAGEMDYLKRRAENLKQVVLGINLDALGDLNGATAYSLYECPPEVARLVEETLSEREGFTAGEQWFQSDHMVFVLNGVPALALTSERLYEILHEIAHTAKDTPDLVDPARLAQAALALADLILALNNFSPA